MPPRRPGGKYKGLVGRSKSEAQLAAEAMAKAKKMQEDTIKKAQMRKDKLMMERQGFSVEEDPEEVRKQKILNMMMGGKKGNAAKFFKAWIIGAAMNRKERKIVERETAWQRHCGHNDPRFPGGCAACARLGPSRFDLALDNFLQTGPPAQADAFRSTMGRTYNGTLRALPTTSGSKSMSFLPKLEGAPRADWLTPEAEKETVSHYKTGKRFLLDTTTMRISKAGSKNAGESWGASTSGVLSTTM
eukprot:gb/GFBE01075302.1/.p1 GENE.gb/GFBE01075302.1/~~gb/GFBE01075302.1/.p1  ORF type:complete len:245 (+),score=62.42 gb/GFBE01075302.1/:1-735(+)